MNTRKSVNQQYEVIKKLKIMQEQESLLTKIINFIIKREEYRLIKFELNRLKFEYESTVSKEKRKELEKLIKEVMGRYVEPKGLDLKLEKDENSSIIHPNSSNNINHRIIKREDRKFDKIKKEIKIDEVKKKPEKIIHHHNHSFEEIRLREEKEKELQSFFNFRIRRDKLDRIVIDRYITSTNPNNNDLFGNSINELLLKEDIDLEPDNNAINLTAKSYTMDPEYSKGKMNLFIELKIRFNKAYYSYLSKKFSLIHDLSDDESDNENFTDVKTLSQNYKTFLKNKKL